jgi:hypothetical protein
MLPEVGFDIIRTVVRALPLAGCLREARDLTRVPVAPRCWSLRARIEHTGQRLDQTGIDRLHPT